MSEVRGITEVGVKIQLFFGQNKWKNEDTPHRNKEIWQGHDFKGKGDVFISR